MTTPRDDLIDRIEGEITLADGTTSKFSISTDGGWQQWGAPDLTRTSNAVEVMARSLLEAELLTSDDDAAADEEEPTP